jgi:hypothetical protein
MKLLRLIPVLMLTACASHAPRNRITVSVAEPTGQPANAAMLRTPEQLKEYRFGRYVDPGEPLVMHESHPVYRIETSSGWNLAPGNAGAPSLLLSTSASTAATHDAIVAEVNKQQAATRTFIGETEQLNQRLSQMSQAIVQIQQLAKQNLDLEGEIAAIRDRLDALDSQIGETKPPAPDATPAPDKW